MNDSNRLPRRDGTGPKSGLGPSVDSLDEVLRRAKSRWLLLRTLGALGIGVCAFSGLAVLGALVLGLFPWAALRWTFIGSLAATIAAVPIFALVTALRSAPATIASRISRSDSRLRSLLLSAVELRNLGPETRGLSTALIEAQAAVAAERAKLVNLKQVILPGPPLACLALGIASLLATAATSRYGPQTLVRGFERLRHLPTPARPGAAVEPITGDIELTYFYPAHTHLAQRTVAGTNGDIEAPAGTQVSLRTRADRAVKQADLVINGTPLALSVSGERALAGSFVVSKPGSYFFRFGPATRPIAEGPPIAIAVQADGPPQISLQAPPEELEAEPKAVLELRYQASDDYGLSEIRLVYRLPGAEKENSVLLSKLAEQPLRFDGTARFDLGPLNLMAGDRVSYALEASDNDDVQGPKVGRSRAHVLKIFSPAEHHREALSRVRALWERLVQLLGDRLDEVSATSASASGAGDARAIQLCQDLEQEAQHLLKDQKQEKGIAVALRNVARGERRRASATADERGAFWDVPSSPRTAPPTPNPPRRALADEIEGLERDVLYLEALLDQATNEDLSTLARELAVRRRELSELLERYRRNPTPELKDQVNALFNRLKARSAELASRMQELAKGLTNQPHLNLEAIPKGFESNLSQVEQALASADVDQALKFLDQLAGQLDMIEKQLTNSRTGETQENQELASKLKEFKDDLDAVQADQTKIADETDRRRRETRKALERKAPVSQSLLDELRAETQRAKVELELVPETELSRGDQSLPDAKERTADLDRALQAKDLDQALQSAERALRAVGLLQGQTGREGLLRSLVGRLADQGPANPQTAQARSHLQQASTPLEDVRDKLQKLFPDERTLLGPEQRQELGKLQHEQARTQERAEALGQKLEQIGKAAPVFDPSAREAVRAAQGFMREAEQRLGRREPGQASEEERGAIEELDRVSKAMKQSGSGRGGGIPNPFALGQTGGEGDSDGSPQASEHVVVPGADQYQVPAQFRRDILDAMKQKTPKSYEDQVKLYYREIVK